LLLGDACSSLSFLPSCVFEKWAPCALEEAKESPRRIVAIRKRHDAGFSGMAERQMRMMNIGR
jgi:hypothetical protein